MQIRQIKRPNNIHLSYILTQYENENDQRGGVVFLPGFKSDMFGSKASFLEGWCQERQINYLRYDYSGHGKSGGDFLEGTIGSWYEDSLFLLRELTKGPQVLVGSSMGGWISLLLAVRHPELVKGLVLIAPAPDFTRNVRTQIETAGQMEFFDKKGYVETPSGYEEPYVFTRKLLDDGEDHILLDGPIEYDGPVRILQGKQDKAVKWQMADDIKSLLTSNDVIIDYVEEGNHSLSRDQDLDLLVHRIQELY